MQERDQQNFLSAQEQREGDPVVDSRFPSAEPGRAPFGGQAYPQISGLRNFSSEQDISFGVENFSNSFKVSASSFKEQINVRNLALAYFYVFYFFS
jgi:hypothetical protein